MKRVNGIGNHYGGLNIREENNLYYWVIENYDTDMEDLGEWCEIPKQLYDELLKQTDSPQLEGKPSNLKTK